MEKANRRISPPANGNLFQALTPKLLFPARENNYANLGLSHFKCFVHVVDDNSPYTRLHKEKQEHFIFVSSGKYMYIEASYWSSGDNAKLQLAVPRAKSYSCLIFYYHMYGSSMGTLNVFNGNVKIFTKSGNQGYYWKKVSRTLQLSDVVSMIP